MNATGRFSVWLTKARTKAKMTMKQLAEKSGVGVSTVHAIEHGQGSPSLDTAEKLVKALGGSMEAVFRVRSVKTTADVHAKSESILEEGCE